MKRVWTVAIAAAGLAAAAWAWAEPAAPPRDPTPLTSTDAAKARRAELRICRKRCDELYPVQVRVVGEGTNFQKTEITGNVSGHDMCSRGCEAGEGPR